MSTMTENIKAYLLSLIHPRTVGKAIVAEGRGIGYVVMRLLHFINASDKKELLATNATLHEKVTGRRRFWFCAGFTLWLFIIVLCYIHRPIGLVLFVWIHITIFFLIGRNDPVLNRVQTAKMAGEALIRKVFDEITLSKSIIKEGKVSTAIVSPPARTSAKTGYEVTARIPGAGSPDVLFTTDGKSALAHKLQKDKKEIFVYPVKGDNSLIRMLVLDTDPWSLPPTHNPLVEHPRQVNLWTDKADLGLYADSTRYLRFLVESGDGGGALFGGAPRRGKTVYLSNVLVNVALDPTANIYMVDGKAVDFENFRRICKVFIGDPDLEDMELLMLATKLLETIKKEVNRRRKILLSAGVAHVTEAVCKQYGFGLEFFVCDELAVLTTDMINRHKKEVLDFQELLSWLVRMGPAFGVFCLLATQRPSNTSVPDEIRSMIIWRTALYVSSVSASHAILGKAGPAHRADWLDPEQKGVAISIGEGQVRAHLIKPSDLLKVAEYAASLRANYRPGNSAPAGAVHPEPIRTVLTFFDQTNSSELKTETLISMLTDHGFKVTPESLAKSMKPFGIGPIRFRINGEQVRGYRRSDFEAVPRIVPVELFGTDDDTEHGIAANEE